jgi:hypothetical protein
MATLFPNDVTGGLNVSQDFSMMGVIGIFCFREQVAERGIVGAGLNPRHLILGIQRRVYHKPRLVQSFVPKVSIFLVPCVVFRFVRDNRMGGSVFIVK